MSDHPNEPVVTAPPAGRRRRAFRSVPRTRERDLPSHIASTIIHALVLVLLILPSLKPLDLKIDEQGAGGPGPAGGGGGGHGGTGGVREEHLQFVAPQPQPQQVVVPPPRIIPPVEVKKPEVVPPPVPTPPVTETAKSADTAKTTSEVASKVAGTGGGSGNDGTSGSGPGKGGGVGSGEGGGRGSGVGDGTGGGSGTVYPPTVTQLVILPMPVPGKVKPYELVAYFDVDSTGHATLLQWNEPKDAGYAKKVLETLKGWRFRPAVRLDGTPVRDTIAVRASVGKGSH